MSVERDVDGTEGSLVEQQRDVARARILKAARRALAARGLATTVDDVAEAAGVSRRTVFRHFSTREHLMASAIREGVRTYAERLPGPPADDDVDGWLEDLLVAMHRTNARNGRIYWELAAKDSELAGELAAAAEEGREARRRLARGVTGKLWAVRGGRGRPPAWLVDAAAVHLSGFTTECLAGDLDRSPEEVARVSARVLEASLAAALTERS